MSEAPAAAPAPAVDAVVDTPRTTAMEKADRVPSYITKATEDFGKENMRLLRDTLCRDLTVEEMGLFLQVCRTKKLDPFSRQIYAVKRYDSRLKREVMTIQTGIDGFRTCAERTGQYRGQLGPFWTDGSFVKDAAGNPVVDENGVVKLIWFPVWIFPGKAPLAARVGVLREGFNQPLWSVAVFSEFVQTFHSGDRAGQAMGLWASHPTVMIAKCAEAVGLRRAFPEELSGLYIGEEMGTIIEAEHAHRTLETLEEKPRELAAPTPEAIAKGKKQASAAKTLADDLRADAAAAEAKVPPAVPLVATPSPTPSPTTNEPAPSPSSSTKPSEPASSLPASPTSTPPAASAASADAPPASSATPAASASTPTPQASPDAAKPADVPASTTTSPAPATTPSATPTASAPSAGPATAPPSTSAAGPAAAPDPASAKGKPGGASASKILFGFCDALDTCTDVAHLASAGKAWADRVGDLPPRPAGYAAAYVTQTKVRLGVVPGDTLAEADKTSLGQLANMRKKAT